MIISRARGYVFVHIPKTGGTSMALALENRAAKDDILIGDTPKALRRRKRLKDMKSAGRLWKHSRLTDVRGILSEEEMRAYFVFTLVRNPWDRMVSYYHWLSQQTFDHPACHAARSLAFSEFLADPAVAGAMTQDAASSYTAGPSGEDMCDMVIPLETLPQRLPDLEARLGLRLTPFPHANTSERPKDYRSCYTPEAVEIVAKAFADDIQRFQYKY